MTSQGRTTNDEVQSAFVTFMVADHYFGVPVKRVQDILTPDTIARVPLGPAEVRGLINLRGRIVTVIDMRTRMALGASSTLGEKPCKCVTVENETEFYTLLVDSVGDVVSLNEDEREPNPATLDPSWSEMADGVFRVGSRLLIVLDVERLLMIRGKA
ncbi:MAG: chemotaxis protein CheW [Rhizomicrobium sp.]|jgi:purine-binding chemotaxis protein CheW